MGDVDLWTWFKRPLKTEPQNSHDLELREIVQLYYAAHPYLSHEPELAVSIFEQARLRAEQINEPCYALFYGIWICDAYLFHIRDTVRGLDYATKLIASTHGSKYHNCPSLGDAYHAIVTAYLIIDPIGYADEIQQALTFLEQNVPLTFDRRCNIWSHRSILAYELDRVDEAIELAMKYVELSQANHYRQFHAYLMLCQYMYNLDDVGRAFEYITNAEIHLNQAKAHQARAPIDVLAWKALLELKHGHEKRAQKWYRQATAKLQQFGGDPWPMYCSHIAEYLELQGKMDQAIMLYEQTKSTVVGTGKHWPICEYWLERCRMMGRLGLPFKYELESAYQASKNLRKPESYLAKLKRIESGDYSCRKA